MRDLGWQSLGAAIILKLWVVRMRTYLKVHLIQVEVFATRVMPSHLAVERINLASHSYGPPVPEDNNDNSNGVTPGIETSPPDDVDLYGNIEECDESTNPSNRSNESVSLPSFSAEVTNFSGIYKSTKYLIFAGIASISPK